jgi:hypothetical protein
LVSVQQQSFRGFANPVDPQPAELKAWAYHPDSVRLDTMPREWDILVASNDKLTETLFGLAADSACPARRFALHCLYIFAADAIRTGFRAHRKSKVRKYVEQAEERGDALLAGWAHNVRVLQRRPDLFDYYDWNEGGLVRNPRRLG